jgi:hypothetical protein
MYASQTDSGTTNILGLGADANTKSITYYTNGIGNEQSDYTVKYAGTAEVDRTYYFYGTAGSNTRAGATAANKAMYASQTDSGTIAVATLGSDTNTKSITYYTNGIGSEQSDYTVKYAGTAEVDRTYYFYGTVGSNNRAGTGTINKAMYASQTDSGTTNILGLGADANTKSITYYANGVGSEQSDYTVKYAGTTEVDRTYYFYGTGASNARAGATTVNKAMYASQTDSGTTNILGLGADSNTKSITYYANGVGSEQSDYTVKYAGTAEVDRTYYFYGTSASNARAGATTVNKAMYASQTDSGTTNILGLGADANTKSITY